MFCPRCGTENEPGDRYCSNCGATLTRAAETEPGERPPLRARLEGLLGTTRRARMITAATALALVVAVFALIALPGNDSGSDVPRDAYTVSADRICTNAKKQIGNASNRALNREPNGAEQYARALVPLVVQWRVDFDALKPPPDRLGRAAALDAALRQVEVQAASVALAAQSHVPDLLARARELDRRTQDVEGAIRDLGLTDCENVVIAPGAPAPG